MSKKLRRTAKAIKLITGSTKVESIALAKTTKATRINKRVLLRGPNKEPVGTATMVDGTLTLTFPEGVVVNPDDDHRKVTVVFPDGKKPKPKKKGVDAAKKGG